MSKQDKQDWYVSIAAAAGFWAMMLANYLYHGGHIVW